MNSSPRFIPRSSFSKRGGCAFALITATMVCVSFGLGESSLLFAQSSRAATTLLSANEPPGSLGYKRRLAGGDIGEDFYQPIRIILPKGARVSPADDPADPTGPRESVFGLNVGIPYRFMISHVPLMEDLPLYPSIELVDRTYAPPGMETRFAIPIELTMEDLRHAASGQYVERVVYVEDPDLALPIAMNRDSAQSVYDVDSDEDPLAFAGSLGRPVAVVRLGSKAPDPNGGDTAFLFGSPSVQRLNPHPYEANSDEASNSTARRSSIPGKSSSPIFKNPRLRRILK